MKIQNVFQVTRSWVLLLLLLAGALPVIGAARLDNPVEGQALARQLRALAPTEPAEFKGTLRISRSGISTREIPLTSKVTIGAEDWTSLYLVKLESGRDETLSIRRLTNQPNDYVWTRGGELSKLKGSDATNQFAGSDFALLDLGMEFWHWPKQVLVTREMRKGRGCDVLESRPERPTVYARVLSWIDQETSGLLMAEAYDATGRILKEFEVKGFKKVAGQWQVREMEIRNRQTKSVTRLFFNFDTP